jgi:hypothetical protein
MLNNAAAMHGFTGVDSYNQQAQEKSHLFTFYSRYDANTFQGIMPDTVAAGVSTAGEPQVKALQKRFPKITVDTSTAGQHKIFFGDNPEILSLETIGVETPFGNVYFAVMPINNPFLFCLADMNRHGVYLNNIDNVLVHNGKEHPIVRKWGHPWLLLNDCKAAVAYCHLTEDVNGKPTNFRITSVRSYHRDGHTAKITPNDVSDDSDDANDEYHPEHAKPIAPKRKRERPPGFKNKPKITVANITNVFIIQKKRDNAEFAVELRREGEITTPGKPFELLNQTEIEALIGNEMFRFK